MIIQIKTRHQVREFLNNSEFFQEHHETNPLTPEFLEWFCEYFAPDSDYIVDIDSVDLELIAGWSCRAWHKAKGYELPC